MRTVYRYENVYGHGPYWYDEWADREARDTMCDSHADMTHPAWGRDMDQRLGYNGYLAACDSREALDAWFDGWHDQLRENGFRVKEFTVPDENVVDSFSGLQCAFKPVRA